ncbi:MAG: sulfur carrier protein ThiS [Pseudomonadota bacterium]
MMIFVNGAATEVTATTLSALLSELGLAEAGPVATALNETFVPAPAREGTALNPGDRVEVLSPRQGG